MDATEPGAGVANNEPATSPLIDIPVIEATGDRPHVAVLAAQPDRTNLLIAAAQSRYTRIGIRVADRISHRWLSRNTTPYRRDVASIAHRLPAAGGWFLNSSFEWSCTCGVFNGDENEPPRLIRVLDWPLDGLGRGLVAARQNGPAGDFVNLTWPGYAGVVTASAGGRFAAAINQAPLRRTKFGLAGDWLFSRPAVWRSHDWLPMHLLRQVFEHCHGYDDAKHALTHTPIAIPAIYSLVGTRPGQGCVIERTRLAATVHDGPVSVANDWQAADPASRPRGWRSADRKAQMDGILAGSRPESFDWLAAPILNKTTRLAALLTPGNGDLLVQGFESAGVVTNTLKLAG